MWLCNKHFIQLVDDFVLMYRYTKCFAFWVFFCTFINNFCPIRHCWHYLNDAVINHLHVVVRERWCYSFRLKPWSSIVNMWIYFSGCYQGMLMCVINSLTTNVKLMGFYFFYPNKASFYTNLFMFWIPSSIPFYIFKNECFSLFLDIWLVFVFQVYFTFLTNLFIFVQFVR